MSLLSPANLARAAACLLAGPSAAQTLDEMQLRASPHHGEVVLVISGMPDPRILQLDFPPRVVLDLVGTRKSLELGPQELAEGPIARVRVGQFAASPVPITRIVADLRRPCLYELQWVDGGLALVLSERQVGATVADNRPLRARSAASAAPNDALARFRTAYHRDRDRAGAMSILLEAISERTIDFDDTENLQAALDDVAEYHVMHRPDDARFTDLVLGLLDLGRIRLIVDQFHDRANRERLAEKSASRTDTAVVGGRGLSAAGRYRNLYLLAVEAERRWRAPVELSIEDLAPEVEEGSRLRYSLTGRNRTGRIVTLPANLMVQVVPADAAQHDAAARSIVPLRAGSFALRAGTSDGALRVEQPVVVRPAKTNEVLVVSLSPGDAVMEVDERRIFTVTANSALQRMGWGVDWEPQSVLFGLKTFEDGGKTIVTIHARQSGVGRLLVTGAGRELAATRLTVLPSAPSRAVPIALACAAAGALAGARAAGEAGNSDLQVWLGYGALPMLAISAGINWWRYREQRAAREKFLATPPAPDPSTAPVAAINRGGR